MARAHSDTGAVPVTSSDVDQTSGGGRPDTEVVTESSLSHDNASWCNNVASSSEGDIR